MKIFFPILFFVFASSLDGKCQDTILFDGNKYIPVQLTEDSTDVEFIKSINKGTPDGRYLSFHLNGRVKEKGDISKGLRVGFWKAYYENGDIFWEGEYQTHTFRGKKLVKQKPIRNSPFWAKKDVFRRKSYKSSYLKNIIIYYNIQDSLFLKWGKSIRKKTYRKAAELSYSIVKGNLKLDGIFKLYYPLQDLFTEFSHLIHTSGEYENGNKIGVWKYYFRNGMLYKETNNNSPFNERAMVLINKNEKESKIFEEFEVLIQYYRSEIMKTSFFSGKNPYLNRSKF